MQFVEALGNVSDFHRPPKCSFCGKIESEESFCDYGIGNFVNVALKRIHVGEWNFYRPEGTQTWKSLVFLKESEAITKNNYVTCAEGHNYWGRKLSQNLYLENQHFFAFPPYTQSSPYSKNNKKYMWCQNYFQLIFTLILIRYLKIFG